MVSSVNATMHVPYFALLNDGDDDGGGDKR